MCDDIIDNIALVESVGKIIIVSFENLVNVKYLYLDKDSNNASININCISEVNNNAFIIASSRHLNNYSENVLKDDDIVCSDVSSSVTSENWPYDIGVFVKYLIIDNVLVGKSVEI